MIATLVAFRCEPATGPQCVCRNGTRTIACSWACTGEQKALAISYRGSITGRFADYKAPTVSKCARRRSSNSRINVSSR